MSGKLQLFLRKTLNSFEYVLRNCCVVLLSIQVGVEKPGLGKNDVTTILTPA